MDDEFGLMPDQDDPTPPRRPAGALVAGLVVVALLAVAAVFWMVTSVAGRGGRITAAGTPATGTAPTTPPTTPAATTTPASTTTSAPTTTPAPRTPEPTAGTVAPPTTRPAPTGPRPVPTATKPAPGPTPSTPVGRLVRVPDVTGLRVQQASTVLRAAGLKVQVVGGVLDPDRDERRVVAQRPLGGQVVLAGSTVILVTDGT